MGEGFNDVLRAAQWVRERDMYMRPRGRLVPLRDLVSMRNIGDKTKKGWSVGCLNSYKR